MKTYSPTSPWFSIVLALGLTLLLSFTWLYLLEYMVPFSRNIRDVEDASQAYYEWYSGIEDALYALSQNSIGFWTRVVSWGFEYTITGTGTVIPAAGLGNSAYNNSRNKISQDQPIQLLIGKSRLLPGSGNNHIRIRVRIPDLNRDNNYTEAFDTSPNDDILLWQVTSSSDSISASWSLLRETDIDDSSYQFWNKNGVKLNGVQQNFWTFYNANCTGTNECILKLLVINPLILSTNNTIIPYLEYIINTQRSIPLRYTQLESDGKTFGFTKKLKVAVPQQTTNSAFDFTIFQ